jgi:cobalt-zinc-cadmium resistance protein CzcA
MLRRIIGFSLEHPGIVLVVSLTIALAGGWAFYNLPIDVFPDLDTVHAELVTSDPGLDSYDVEKQITLPLERALLTVPRLERMRSLSMFGLSDVKLSFKEGTGWDDARHDMAVALQGVPLPPGVAWQLAPPSDSLGTIYRYVIDAPGLDLIQKRQLQDWVIAPQLQRVSGVAGTSTFGGGGKEYQINVDPAMLLQYGVTLDQVLAAVSANNANTGGSYINQGDTALIIRSEGLLRHLEDIESIVVATVNGAPVLVKHVATVKRGSIPRVGYFLFGERDDEVEGIVLMQIGQDPGTVCAAVDERLKFVEKTLLPKGVHLRSFYDRRDLIHNVVRTVVGNQLKGVILVLLLLFVFFSDLRTAAIVSLLVPLALLLAFLVAWLTGIPANLLSLGTIDFGIVIDGSLVITEAIVARIAFATARSDEMRIVRETSEELAHPIVSALLIMVVSFFPIFIFRGVVGRMFTPVALIFTLAMLGALGFSLTFVPACAKLLIRNRPTLRENFVSHALAAVYRPILSWSLSNAGPLIVTAAILLVGAGVVGSRIERTFLPDLEEGNVYMDHDVPIAATVATTHRIERQVADTVLSFKHEVKTYYGEIGRTDDGLTPNAMSHIESFVDLYPPEQWDPEFKTKDDLRKALDSKLAEIPEVEFNHDMYITDSVREGLSGFNGEVVISIHGIDIAYMEQFAGKMIALFKTVPGVADVHMKREMGLPLVQIKLDREACARYGVPIQQVQNTINEAVTGAQGTTFYEDDQIYPVVLRLDPKFRDKVSSLNELLVAAPSGPLIPLTQLAKVEVVDGPQRIWRVNFERIMPVQFNVVGRGLVDVVEDCQKLFKKELEPLLRPRYFVTWEGAFEEANQAMRTSVIAIVASLVVIFLLHVLHFGSSKYALLCMVAYPFGAIGGIIALKVSGTLLGISALIGFLSLGGITAIDGIILVARFNTLRAQGEPLAKAVFDGATSRLRPVVMTAAAGIFGFLPMIASQRMGAEVQKPIATVIVGGLITSTILTLLVLPSFYLVVEGWLERRREARGEVTQ